LLSKAPDNSRAKNNIAVVLTEQGKTEEAEEYYREAIDLNPDYAKAVINLGQLHQERGDHKQAIDNLLNQAVDLKVEFT